MTIAILVSVFCVASCHTIAPAYAQSPEPTAISFAYSGQYPQTQGYFGEVIRGLVLDENGKPVSGATVTLRQNGSIWKLNTGLTVDGGDVNPRTSGIYGKKEGSFLFGLVAPGIYDVTVEKDGSCGATAIEIDNVTVHVSSMEEFDRATKTVNVTLKGYRVPVLSQEQLSCPGGIAGTIKTVQEYWMDGTYVYLWRDGELVTLPENPQAAFTRDYQGRTVNFLFEHLAPGRYEVAALSHGDYKDNVSVNVTDHIEYVDIRSFAFGMVAPELLPVALPLVSIGLAALIIVRLRKVG